MLPPPPSEPPFHVFFSEHATLPLSPATSPLPFLRYTPSKQGRKLHGRRPCNLFAPPLWSSPLLATTTKRSASFSSETSSKELNQGGINQSHHHRFSISATALQRSWRRRLTSPTFFVPFFGVLVSLRYPWTLPSSSSLPGSSRRR
jgi:hypothetical protein